MRPSQEYTSRPTEPIIWKGVQAADRRRRNLDSAGVDHAAELVARRLQRGCCCGDQMKYALQPLLSNLVGATFGELYCDDDERSEPF